jgi:hypothetical protein
LLKKHTSKSNSHHRRSLSAPVEPIEPEEKPKIKRSTASSADYPSLPFFLLFGWIIS